MLNRERLCSCGRVSDTQDMLREIKKQFVTFQMEVWKELRAYRKILEDEIANMQNAVDEYIKGQQ